MTDETTQLSLTGHEVTVILEALADRPYKESASIINKIINQQANQKIKRGGTQ